MYLQTLLLRDGDQQSCIFLGVCEIDHILQMVIALLGLSTLQQTISSPAVHHRSPG